MPVGGPQSGESPHVHVYTSYLSELRNNWAYQGTNKTPGRTKADKKLLDQK